MCASYGLDPRLGDYKSLARANDREMIDNLIAWAGRNDNETVRPTGKNLRNLNPMFREVAGARQLELGWWGYLVGGEPAKFPSINTRSERLRERPGGANGRALVPATSWFEFEKPSKARWSFGTGEPFAMAVVTQRGVPAGGEPVTCYSIIMQPARPDLAHIHDRMPLLLPLSFHDEWLAADRPGSPELIDAALDAGRELTEQVVATPA